MDKDFFIGRRKKLMDEFYNNSMVVLFSGKSKHRSADQEYPFTVNRNFYYMTGLERQEFILVIQKNGNGEATETIFIEEADPVREKWIGKRMREDEAKNISGIESVKFLNGFKGFFNQQVMKNNIEYIYLDLERRSFNWSDALSHDFAKEIKENYPELDIKNIYNNIVELRMIKAKDEIDNIRKAIQITGEGIKSLMKNSVPGMKEYQLEAHFDFTCKTLGARNLAFPTIAASGANATVLHYEDNNCEIKDGDLVLFDLGAEHENYCADITRTFPVNGKFTQRQKQIYNIVLKAMEETIKGVKPGITFTQLNDITKKVLADECKKIDLIKEDKDLSKYYYHGVSHSLGLDTHDVFISDTVLKAGMVLTIEPGLYIEEEGIGIRIEDDVVVTEDGCENLSADIIKKVEDIEAFMNRNL